MKVGMKILHRDWRGIYRHNFSHKRKKWEDDKNDESKSNFNDSSCGPLRSVMNLL
jgi:hypothetical protein